MPPVSAPALPPIHTIFDGAPPVECCAACRFWQRDAAQEAPGRGRVAACRRYPPQAVLATQFQKQLGPQGPAMVPVQVPGCVPVVTAAADWCGEFFLETRASAYVDRAGQ